MEHILPLILWSLIVLFHTISGDIDEPVEVEPRSTNVIVPLGQQAHFHCRPGHGYNFLTWGFTSPNSSYLPGTSVQAFRFQALEITQNSSSLESYITIKATKIVDNIDILCAVIDPTKFIKLNILRSSKIRLHFYGPPQAPENITIRNVGENLLYIVWDFHFNLGINYEFSVEVTINNSLSGDHSTLVFTGLVNTSFLLNLSTSFCDVVNIRVWAGNDAGEGEKSEQIRWLPPYSTSATPLSLRYSISKKDNKTNLLLSIQASEVCQEYIFDVVLEDLAGTYKELRLKALQETTVELAEDQVYFLKVKHDGTLLIQERLVTSDVQDVEVCTAENAFQIRCLFLARSTVNWCGYTLIDGSNNKIIGFVPRRRSDGIQVGVSHTAYFRRIVVYDASSLKVFSSNVSITKPLKNLSQCKYKRKIPMTRPTIRNTHSTKLEGHWLIFIIPIVIIVFSI